jgi:hypothetical protein
MRQIRSKAASLYQTDVFVAHAKKLAADFEGV